MRQPSGALATAGSRQKSGRGLPHSMTLARNSQTPEIILSVIKFPKQRREAWRRKVRGGIERRVDAVTADVIQVGIIFLHVYGRDNADAFFLTADIVPTVYRRIIAGQFRRTVRGADPEPEGIPA